MVEAGTLKVMKRDIWLAWMVMVPCVAPWASM